MSNFNSYMDGVPVKISEKFKPPPRICLPHGVVESIAIAEEYVRYADYNFDFENNVLSKLDQLKKTKQQEKSERDHRLQILKEAKQKKLDLIAAAETEEKLKQLSVSEVSYPSTEEISEISPDDSILDKKREDSTCLSPENALPESHCVTQLQITNSYVNFNETHMNGYCTTDKNILKPTPIMPSNVDYRNACLLDDPDPFNDMRLNRAKLMQLQHYVKNSDIDKLTFSDFENDTSSPFDNMELKTINDKQLLAEVLNQDNSINRFPYTSTASDYSQNLNPQTNSYNNDGVNFAQVSYTYHAPAVYDQNNHSSTTIHNYTNPDIYNSNNKYSDVIASHDTLSHNKSMAETKSEYPPYYSYYGDPVFQNSVAPESKLFVPNHVILNTQATTNPSTDMPVQPYYYVPPNIDYNSRSVPFSDKEVEINKFSCSVSSNMAKTRSKSVPDIVKELNDDLNLMKMKSSERSSTSSPAPAVPSKGSMPSTCRQGHQDIDLPDSHLSVFNTLPDSAKRMCTIISGMGFDLGTVARTYQLIGENDKNIIEYLLHLGQFQDLGFKESEILAALRKNNFDRDKALDDLLS